jgi:hypothetical protein
MRNDIGKGIKNWWYGGEAVKDYGSLVFYRTPQSFSQRLRSRLAKWTNQPYGVALIAGIAVAGISKLLGLA